MAVVKNVVKVLVFVGGAALWTASVLAGCAKADSGTTNSATPGEGSPQERPTVLHPVSGDLETLRDAADNEPIINLYGVMAPWEIEEQERMLEEERRKREEAGGGVGPLLPPEPQYPVALYGVIPPPKPARGSR